MIINFPYDSSMDIKRLRTLVMVAETGGFSAAADRLFITQSAVSMQMKALEADWRVTLFDRSTRPPSLTRRGWTLARRARALVEQYELLQSGAGEGDLVGSLRVGVVPSAATDLLPQAMLRLRSSHPGLTVRARSGLSADLMAMVGQGRLDAAVVTAPDRLEAGMVAERVRSEELKLFARHDLVMADVGRMLESRPFLQFSGAMGVGRIVDEALRARGIRVNAIAELDSIEAILGMVHLGLGIAILPEHSMAGRAGGDLARIALSPPIRREVALVARRDFMALPEIGLLLETFQAVAGLRGGDRA
ncbi:MAG: DNA-binding transcriptional LysR family regulator [Paracoccaceae bacterium]|jgi:DNA-binding transcriptional LysR family regulator